MTAQILGVGAIVAEPTYIHRSSCCFATQTSKLSAPPPVSSLCYLVFLVWWCGRGGRERKGKYWIPDQVRNDIYGAGVVMGRMGMQTRYDVCGPRKAQNRNRRNGDTPLGRAIHESPLQEIPGLWLLHLIVNTPQACHFELLSWPCGSDVP